MSMLGGAAYDVVSSAAGRISLSWWGGTVVPTQCESDAC